MLKYGVVVLAAMGLIEVDAMLAPRATRQLVGRGIRRMGSEVPKSRGRAGNIGSEGAQTGFKLNNKNQSRCNHVFGMILNRFITKNILKKSIS